MIVDIPIQTAATVRKVRARSSIETAHTVVRPVSIPSATDDEAPVFARSGTDDDPFGDVVAWRMHGGRQFVEVGRAAEAARIVGTRVFNHTDAILRTAAGGDERTVTKPGDVREVERTNETAVAAMAQKIVDKRFLVVGTKLYEIAPPPVVTVEYAAKKHGSNAQRIEGLPACLWDMDARTLKKIFDDGKPGRFNAKAPEILRPDMIGFDRNAAIARHLAEKTATSMRREKTVDAGHPSVLLARIARSDADASTMLQATQDAIDNFGGRDLPLTRSVASMTERLMLRRSDHLEPDADGRVALSLRPGGDDAPMIVVRPAVLDPSEIRTVASIRHETGAPSFVSIDGTSFIGEMSTGSARRALDLSDRAVDAYWRSWASDILVSLMEEMGQLAIPAFPKTLKYDENVIEDIQKFAYDNLLVIDGKLHMRIDEPHIIVHKEEIAVVLPARGTGIERLERSVRDSWKHTSQTELPFGMPEASLAAEAARILTPKAQQIVVDILAPEVFTTKGPPPTN
jgi:hypothetical protein